MALLLIPTILLWIMQCNFASAMYDLKWRIQKDLQEFNVSCFFNSCVQERASDSLKLYNCQCGSTCVYYGTCCIDSPYCSRTRPRLPLGCRSMGSTYYQMVDRCPSGNAWKTSCETEWSLEGDMKNFVPVTSLYTRITYKNYFCFRCYETSDNFLFWNVELGGKTDFLQSTSTGKPVSLTYDRNNQTWLAPLGNGGSLVAVHLNVKVPTEISDFTASCNPELISRCAEAWSNEDTRRKCESYMGQILTFKENLGTTYQNAHCAVCNFQNVGEMRCRSIAGTPYSFDGKVPFSFTYLIDINRIDGNFVGRVERCRSTHVWDPYTETCRELSCALPGYVIRNGRCEIE